MLGEYLDASAMKGKVFPFFVAFQMTKNGKERMHVLKSIQW
jgi:hypothetical protein